MEMARVRTILFKKACGEKFPSLYYDCKPLHKLTDVKKTSSYYWIIGAGGGKHVWPMTMSCSTLRGSKGVN